MTLLMQLTGVAGKGRLEPATAAVNAGEILHLVGPNGAGKSTLLARMAGLTRGEGEITFSGNRSSTGYPLHSPPVEAIWFSSRFRPLQCPSGTT